jgi:NTP pyrophosphatase (non-canonical NTP hydrolase)
MDFKQLSEKAIEVRNKYSELEIKKYGKEWTKEQIAEGFVGDVGDLMKLVLAKSGVREIENVDEKLAHELADCLWCILVLAKKYNIEIESTFIETMDGLSNKIEAELKK